MHIFSIGSAAPAPLTSPGKAKAVPPGLARRELDLPPGIAKKLDGTIPPGIAKRFPSATVQPVDPLTTPETSPASEPVAAQIDVITPADGSSGSSSSMSSVDLFV
jgi:hypothetical protein